MKNVNEVLCKSAPIYGRSTGEVALLRSLPPLVGEVSAKPTKGAMNPPLQLRWPSPPSFVRRVKGAAFQIEKSAPTCGGSVGEADEGGKNNFKGLSYIQRLASFHIRTCITYK